MDSEKEIFNFKSKRLLITGGAGFIGGAMIRKLLIETDLEIFNIDKCGYASDLESIKHFKLNKRFHHINIDLNYKEKVFEAVANSRPDFVLHFAAESHVDRSIDNPQKFIESNILGTFNLLEAVKHFFKKLDEDKRKEFKFLHISTDEVFGSLDQTGYFNELSRYDPRSPYSATKASSDHLVLAWFHTYNIPVLLTNCSNNFGPWQFPEKFIPLIILKAYKREQIPIYGDGQNIRDWLYVDDHIDAIIQLLLKGKVGQRYCIGGKNEKTNNEVAKLICEIFDQRFPERPKHKSLIKKVTDRPGHDRRYAIDTSKIENELNWRPKKEFNEALFLTVNWYLDNIKWTEKMIESSQYNIQRLGLEIN